MHISRDEDLEKRKSYSEELSVYEKSYSGAWRC